MHSLKKPIIILSMATLMALGMAALLPSPALAACTPAATSLDDFIVCDGVVASLFNALAGNDTITNYGEVIAIFGDEGNDSITNYGLVDGMYGDKGNDTLTNYGEAYYIDGRAGDDRLTNYGITTYLVGAEGNDIITNYGEVFVIFGLADNDIITNYGVAIVVNGNAGNDTITNYGTARFIEEDTGNDIIINNGVVTEWIKAGTGDDLVILGRVFVMSGLIDGEADFDTLEFDTVGDTRADVRALLLALAENKGEGTLTWRGETFSWVNFEALTGNARYRSAVVSDGLIRVTETLDSLLIIGLDKGKINIAVPVNFTRLKHVVDGQTIANFTDKDGYNLQLSVLSAEDNLWTVFYYAPDDALISSYSFEFDPIW